ncbi:hypothetical protein ACW9HR_37215 [Nocardia gipuzkoensis]
MARSSTDSPRLEAPAADRQSNDEAGPDTDPGEYRIEIRTDFCGTEADAHIQAQRLATMCGGEVTAIFDKLNDYEEL